MSFINSILFLLCITVSFIKALEKDPWWLKIAKKQGPMVCAGEYVKDSERHFATPWTGGSYCESETIIRFSCCHGYDRVNGERGCPLVKPLKNLAETAQEFGANKFIEHAEQSGLLPSLRDRGAYTLFIAADEAFQFLTKEQEKALNNSKKSRNRPPVLLYTVAEGRIPAEDLPDSLVTLYREGSIVVSRFPNGLMAVNCIPLVATNIEATNGLVHVTESVLLPPGRTTIPDLIVRTPSLSVTASAVVKSQLANRLRDIKPVTIFAPTDAAWDALPQSFRDAILEDPAALKVLMQNLVIEGVWCPAVSATTSELTTLGGSKLTISCNSSSHFVNNARIIHSDHRSGNGIVHHIDAVIVPEQEANVLEVGKSEDVIIKISTAIIIAYEDMEHWERPSPYQSGDENMTVHSLAEYLDFRGMKYFLKLAEASDLLTLMQRPDSYTVFVPEDSVFEALPNHTLTEILNEPSLAREVVSYHIVQSRLLTTNIIDGQKVSPMMNTGSPLRLKFQKKRLTVESALVTESDLETRNGVIHIIDRILSPPTQTVLEILQKGNFSTFIQLLDSTEPNLLKLLDNVTMSFTIFAPSDAVMNQTVPGLLQRLLADPPLLYKTIGRHILPAFVVSNSLEPYLTYSFPTVNNDTISVTGESDGSLTVARLAQVTEPETLATNGVVFETSRFIELS